MSLDKNYFGYTIYSLIFNTLNTYLVIIHANILKFNKVVQSVEKVPLSSL